MNKHRVIYNNDIDISLPFCCYQTTNKINGKFYRGKAKTKNVLKNQYMGSGSILLKNAIPKYGKDNFEVEIIKTFENESDAYEFEKTFVVLDRNISYNITPGGLGGSSGCVVVNNGKFQYRIDPSLLDIFLADGFTLGELESNFKKRREPAKKKLEEKYGICTGAMITPEAIQKSMQTHIEKYGSVCGHMLTPERKARSKRTREEKYGHSMGACHTPEGEKLANERCHQTFLQKYGHVTGRLQEFQDKAHKNSAITFAKKKNVTHSKEFLEWYENVRHNYKSKSLAVYDFLSFVGKTLDDYK